MFSTLKKYNTSTLGGILLHLLLAGSLLFILALAYFYWYLPSVTHHGESMTVPNIEGLHVDKLDEALVNRGLRWEVDDSSYSEKYPPLTVLKQFPHAGSKVKENRKIYISINRLTPPTVPLPNLVDRSVTNAEAVLKSSELKRGRIELVSGPFLNVVQGMKYEGANVKEGTKVPKGSSIDLVVMDGGSKDLQAPNVVGHSLEDAKVLIFGYNLNMGTIHPIGDTTGVGAVVLKQKPGAFETIKVGDIVELWIGQEGTEVPEEDE